MLHGFSSDRPIFYEYRRRKLRYTLFIDFRIIMEPFMFFVAKTSASIIHVTTIFTTLIWIIAPRPPL